ncbi:MAG: formylmethanofuran dehydrogenase subunit C [Methanoregula sp. SKADARSKE-2]|nr:MAG: formylmethanofuran dehydrogenase subunit C [Methanoregula sp. SKADARSKE-2]
MAKVILTPKKVPELMLEAPCITTDAFAKKTPAQIADLEVREGKIPFKLGEYFEIVGNPGESAAETEIEIAGDCSRVKYIGTKMTAGLITVKGNADMYTGGWMKGGKIHIVGDVHSFCGIAMEGGDILVDGNAQNHVGCAYRGDWRGMRGGTIRIRGSAGNDIGTFMLGGTIIIEKEVFIHVSTHAEGGTVIIKGNVTGRVGGQMVKGDIYVLGKIQHILPGFTKVDQVRKEVDGQTFTLDHYIGDLGERHPKSKGKEIFANLYVRAAA